MIFNPGDFFIGPDSDLAIDQDQYPNPDPAVMRNRVKAPP